jgi:hypothetical protein
MQEHHRAFALESYRQIRSEVSVLLARIENLFRYALVVSATVFAWVLTQAFGTSSSAPAVSCLKLPKDALVLAWWIPFSFVVLSGLIVLITHMRVLQMGEFLKKCEEYLGDPKLSWECYLQPKLPIFTTGTVLAWGCMLWGTYHAACTGLAYISLNLCQNNS